MFFNMNNGDSITAFVSFEMVKMAFKQLLRQLGLLKKKKTFKLPTEMYSLWGISILAHIVLYIFWVNPFWLCFVGVFFSTRGGSQGVRGQARAPRG